jgi:hypothetical protein
MQQCTRPNSCHFLTNKCFKHPFSTSMNVMFFEVDSIKELKGSELKISFVRHLQQDTYSFLYLFTSFFFIILIYEFKSFKSSKHFKNSFLFCIHSNSEHFLKKIKLWSTSYVIWEPDLSMKFHKAWRITVTEKNATKKLTVFYIYLLLFFS